VDAAGHISPQQRAPAAATGARRRARPPV